MLSPLHLSMLRNKKPGTQTAEHEPRNPAGNHILSEMSQNADDETFILQTGIDMPGAVDLRLDLR